MESGAPSVCRRLKALEILHNEGLTTYIFISPIFPYITDIHAIVDAAIGFVDQVCFENLNLRGGAKQDILDYVGEKYPQYLDRYKDIFLKGDMSYWQRLETEINAMSKKYDIPFVNYFYHAKIRKGGRKND